MGAFEPVAGESVLGAVFPEADELFTVVVAAAVVSVLPPDAEAEVLPVRVVVVPDLDAVDVVLAVVVVLLNFAVVVGCDGGFIYEAAEVFIAVCICVVFSPKGTPLA